jgi:hypothetical protein
MTPDEIADLPTKPPAPPESTGPELTEPTFTNLLGFEASLGVPLGTFTPEQLINLSRRGEKAQKLLVEHMTRPEPRRTIPVGGQQLTPAQSRLQEEKTKLFGQLEDAQEKLANPFRGFPSLPPIFQDPGITPTGANTEPILPTGANVIDDNFLQIMQGAIRNQLLTGALPFLGGGLNLIPLLNEIGGFNLQVPRSPSVGASLFNRLGGNFVF